MRQFQQLPTKAGNGRLGLNRHCSSVSFERLCHCNTIDLNMNEYESEIDSESESESEYENLGVWLCGGRACEWG